MRESEPCGLEGIHVCMTVGRWCVCVSCGNVFITRVTPCHCVCKQPTRYHKCSFNGWADNFNPQPSPTTILLNVILSPRMGKTPDFSPCHAVYFTSYSLTSVFMLSFPGYSHKWTCQNTTLFTQSETTNTSREYISMLPFPCCLLNPQPVNIKPNSPPLLCGMWINSKSGTNTTTSLGLIYLHEPGRILSSSYDHDHLIMACGQGHGVLDTDTFTLTCVEDRIRTLLTELNHTLALLNIYPVTCRLLITPVSLF